MSEPKLYKIRLKKGDTVIVRSGKHKGRTGKILALHPKQNKVTVEGINIVKRHIKPTRVNPQGGIVELTKPIWVSKIAVYDSTKKKPSRISYKTDNKGNKARVMKTSGKELK
ncbi:MAG TPA: 50S ribosomal protein L24 [Candidatus Saccharimonadales bacterium]|nr:50S ribosomal protein L24 [Candidatus Saccharimonadales bacterium]